MEGRGSQDSLASHFEDENFLFEIFDFTMPGRNLRSLESKREYNQTDGIEFIVSQWRTNAEYFISRINEMPLFETQKDVDKSSWFGFQIIITNPKSVSRHDVVSQLEKNGIETRPIVAGNFARNKAVEYMDYSIHGNLDNADYLHQNGFFVGNHSVCNDAGIITIVEVLREI